MQREAAKCKSFATVPRYIMHSVLVYVYYIGTTNDCGGLFVKECARILVPGTVAYGVSDCLLRWDRLLTANDVCGSKGLCQTLAMSPQSNVVVVDNYLKF